MEKTYLDGISDLEYAAEALMILYKNYTKTGELDKKSVIGAIAVAYLGERRLLASIGEDREVVERAEALAELPTEVLSR